MGSAEVRGDLSPEPLVGLRALAVEVHGDLLRVVRGPLAGASHVAGGLVGGEAGEELERLVERPDAEAVPSEDRDHDGPGLLAGAAHRALDVGLDLLDGLDDGVAGLAAVGHEVDEHLLALGPLVCGLALEGAAVPHGREADHREGEGAEAEVLPPVLHEGPAVVLVLLDEEGDAGVDGVAEEVLRGEVDGVGREEVGDDPAPGAEQAVVRFLADAGHGPGEGGVAVHPDHAVLAADLHMDEVLVAVPLAGHDESEVDALAALPGFLPLLLRLHLRLEGLDVLALLRFGEGPLAGGGVLDIPRLPHGEEAVLAEVGGEAVERLACVVLVALDDFLEGDVEDVGQRVVRLGPAALRVLDDLVVALVGADEAGVVVFLLGRSLDESAEREVVVPHAGLLLRAAEPLVLVLREKAVPVRVVEGVVGAGADGVPELVEERVVSDLGLEGVDHCACVGLGLAPFLLRSSHEGGDTGPVLGLAAVVALPLVALQAGDGVEVVEDALVGVLPFIRG